MPRLLIGSVVLTLALLTSGTCREKSAESPRLEAGFAQVEITPDLKERPCFLAGFGKNRRATGVHDPLFARAVVLREGPKRIAIVSVDLVGLFLASVERVRGQLAEFDYVLVSSTHNHEGPDTMGLWGAGPFESGVDPAYLQQVEQRIVAAVRSAARNCKPATARLGVAKAPELLHDSREPIVKHDELTALAFADSAGKPVGLVVAWNCHPETLDSKNTQISADYVGYTVEHLRKRHECPVVYLTGTVGGLMTSLHVEVRDRQGRALADGTYEKTARYGELLADVADRAIKVARPTRLTPIGIHVRKLYLPMENKLYTLARQLGVLEREAFAWTGDVRQAEKLPSGEHGKPMAVRTEIAWLRLGDLDVAAIPGEIYPELVLGKVQDPPDPGADFPDAPIEPAIYAQLKGPHRLLIGLANDELGYIIPRRQWDEKPPYCYGRKKPPYGEINSLGPRTAPLLCEAFRELTRRD